MQVKTLFLTNRDDVSVEYLIGKYSEHSDAYLRINSEDLDILNFEIDPEGNAVCFADGKEYELSTVQSVVFKRVPTKYNNPVGDENSAYLNNERKHFFEGLYLTFDNAKWINPMFATHIAERKIYQLKIAAQLGLQIPKSLVTNKLGTAIGFLSVQSKAIIKPISNGLQVLKDKVYSIYTTEVTSDDFRKLNLANTFSTPVFLQERIQNKYDIRVTIVGQTVFAVRIGKESAEVDWRKPEIIKHYEIAVLPQTLIDKLLRLTSKFGMIYSAIDLIENPEGEFVFLEINPVGEWVWLEQELGLNISKSLIEELL